MYTRYTCIWHHIYTYTPLNTSKHHINTPYTPYIRPKAAIAAAEAGVSAKTLSRFKANGQHLLTVPDTVTTTGKMGL